MSHVGAIEQDSIEAGFRATCSCGWSGEKRPGQWDADGDLRAHYAAHTSPVGKCFLCRKPRAQCCC